MTAGMKPVPFSATPEDVARAVVAAVRDRTDEVWVPGVLRGVMSVLRHLPRPVFRRLPI
jgi:decaprenylphospho-beta-D-erythro-pentofuranosid-2-ulose 2-reductase